MKLQFDFGNVETTEFGVGRDERDSRTFYHVPVDGKVQQALREMANATWNAMRNNEESPSKYEAGEKHASVEHFYIPIGDGLTTGLQELHQATNLPVDTAALSDPQEVFCYFAAFTDTNRRRLTAVRRASQFKGVLKNRLIRVVSDTLKIIEDRVFKLDADFDLLIDGQNIHILRPSGFEFVAQLQSAILAAVPDNVAAIQKDVPFVDFDSVAAYASTHPRAARYLASIREQAAMNNIDKGKLKALCKKTGVSVVERNGKLSVEDKVIMGFLEVLDRRRYEIELVKNSPEQYRAPSRQKIVSGNRD